MNMRKTGEIFMTIVVMGLILYACYDVAFNNGRVFMFMLEEIKKLYNLILDFLWTISLKLKGFNF